jgi:hypothetical protein
MSLSQQPETSVPAVTSISGGEPAPQTKRAKKAYVIGNCQVKTLAYALNYYSADVEFDHVQVHSLHPTKAEAHINKRIDEIRVDADFILAFNLSDKFFGLAKEQIGSTFAGRPIVTISNLFFGGYHPDIVVLGLPHKRIDGPLDQYRSRIGLYGFMNGKSVRETMTLFREDVYEKLGYFNEWRQSLGRLLKADEDVEIKFAGVFGELLRQRLSMYVLNHPTPVVFSTWARAITTALAERGLSTVRDWQPDEALFPALFTDTAVFPVYPEIAKRHELAFPGSYIFKGKAYQTDSFMDLEQYLTAEFGALEEAGRDEIRASAQWAVVDRRFAEFKP